MGEEVIFDDLALSNENGIAISEQVETGQEEARSSFIDLCGEVIKGDDSKSLIEAHNSDMDRCVDILKDDTLKLSPEEKVKILDVIMDETVKFPTVNFTDHDNNRKHTLLIVLIAAAVIAGASGAIVKLIDYFGKKDQNADNKDAKLIEEA